MIKIKFDKNNNKSIAYDNNIKVGECDFIELEECWNIIHTEVSNLYQGQGIARKLVECIIENAKKHNKKLIAECSYAKKVFDKTVTGTVIQISRKGEIFVDFQYKADGIIPKSEYSDDENKNPQDEFKSGDTITADVLKWNDGFGNVLLSYKKYKIREEIEKEKALKIKQAKEREQQKRERAKNIEDFWNNIKIGQTYTGTISKIADYGIFVDLGLVTGLAHVSELLWDKSQKLEDKFNINDEIEVKIKDFNKEEKRISLEYPLKGENPWFALADKYKINDIVTCKVVKFAPFGAFLEIEKGLEGLVHNSEITSLKRVVKPEDELELGQIVNAKIIDIDKEKLKIGLSIKEIEGTSAEYGYAEYIGEAQV